MSKATTGWFSLYLQEDGQLPDDPQSFAKNIKSSSAVEASYLQKSRSKLFYPRLQPLLRRDPPTSETRTRSSGGPSPKPASGTSSGTCIPKLLGGLWGIRNWLNYFSSGVLVAAQARTIASSLPSRDMLLPLYTRTIRTKRARGLQHRAAICWLSYEVLLPAQRVRVMRSIFRLQV